MNPTKGKTMKKPIIIGLILGLIAYLADAYRRYIKYTQKAYPNDDFVIKDKKRIQNVKDACHDLKAEVEAWIIRRKFRGVDFIEPPQDR
jgi:hypothetical protein